MTTIQRVSADARTQWAQAREWMDLCLGTLNHRGAHTAVEVDLKSFCAHQMTMDFPTEASMDALRVLAAQVNPNPSRRLVESLIGTEFPSVELLTDHIVESCDGHPSAIAFRLAGRSYAYISYILEDLATWDRD
jgi:hypothetical protein